MSRNESIRHFCRATPVQHHPKHSLKRFKLPVILVSVLMLWGGFLFSAYAGSYAEEYTVSINTQGGLFTFAATGCYEDNSIPWTETCENGTYSGTANLTNYNPPRTYGYYHCQFCRAGTTVCSTKLIVTIDGCDVPPPPEPIPTTADKNKGMCSAPQYAAKATVGNPIHAKTGNKSQLETDLTATTLNGIRFHRYYNSQDDRAGVLGANWRHTYERKVLVAEDRSTAAVIRADGKIYIYTPSGSNWITDPDVTATLSETATGWTYSMTSGTVEQYDTSGHLLSITNLQGLSQTLAYDATGKLETVTDAFGQTLSFTYDAQNRIDIITSPTGNIQFSYDANNNLEYVTYPDTNIRQYLYENTSFVHALTGIKDERGIRYATWAYDDQGRAYISEYAGGVDKVSLAYNADGTTTVTNSLAVDSNYNFSNQYDCFAG